MDIQAKDDDSGEIQCGWNDKDLLSASNSHSTVLRDASKAYER
jgi:hypothetical protein